MSQGTRTGGRFAGVARVVTVLARVVIALLWGNPDDSRMASHISVASIASLVTGTILFGVIQQWPIAPLAWISVGLLLHAARTMPASAGLACVYIALYLAFAGGNRGLLPVPGPAYFLVVAAIAIASWLPFLADRLCGRGLNPLLQTLIFALAWVSVDFVRSRLTPFSTWQSIGYTQSSATAMMQLVAISGIWGITFLVTWGASVAEFAWSRQFDWNTIRIPALSFMSVMALVVIGGAIRLGLAPTDRPTIRMAIVNRPDGIFVPGEMTRLAGGILPDSDREAMVGKLARLHDWFLNQSRREAAAGARLVAWPEVSLIVFSSDEPAFIARAQHLAADAGVYLAMGINTVHLGEKPPSENKFVLIDPSGRVVVNYQKSHPLMGWEAGVIRKGPPIMPVVMSDLGMLAGAICNDSSFPEFVRQAGQGRADLLVEPVNDWREVRTIHFQMDAARAIENGVSLLRPAANGLSGAVDPWGRTLAKADYFADGDRTMTVQMPIGRVPTPYSFIGDLFAWLCVAGLAATLIISRLG